MTLSRVVRQDVVKITWNCSDTHRRPIYSCISRPAHEPVVCSCPGKMAKQMRPVCGGFLEAQETLC